MFCYNIVDGVASSHVRVVGFVEVPIESGFCCAMSQTIRKEALSAVCCLLLELVERMEK